MTETVNGQPGEGEWLRRVNYQQLRNFQRSAAVRVPFQTYKARESEPCTERRLSCVGCDRSLAGGIPGKG